MHNTSLDVAIRQQKQTGYESTPEDFHVIESFLALFSEKKQERRQALKRQALKLENEKLNSLALSDVVAGKKSYRKTLDRRNIEAEGISWSQLPQKKLNSYDYICAELLPLDIRAGVSFASEEGEVITANSLIGFFGDELSTQQKFRNLKALLEIYASFTESTPEIQKIRRFLSAKNIEALIEILLFGPLAICVQNNQGITYATTPRDIDHSVAVNAGLLQKLVDIRVNSNNFLYEFSLKIIDKLQDHLNYKHSIDRQLPRFYAAELAKLTLNPDWQTRFFNFNKSHPYYRFNKAQVLTLLNYAEDPNLLINILRKPTWFEKYVGKKRDFIQEFNLTRNDLVSLEALRRIKWPSHPASSELQKVIDLLPLSTSLKKFEEQVGISIATIQTENERVKSETLEVNPVNIDHWGEDEDDLEQLGWLEQMQGGDSNKDLLGNTPDALIVDVSQGNLGATSLVDLELNTSPAASFTFSDKHSKVTPSSGKQRISHLPPSGLTNSTSRRELADSPKALISDTSRVDFDDFDDLSSPVAPNLYSDKQGSRLHPRMLDLSFSRMDRQSGSHFAAGGSPAGLFESSPLTPKGNGVVATPNALFTGSSHGRTPQSFFHKRFDHGSEIEKRPPNTRGAFLPESLQIGRRK